VQSFGSSDIIRARVDAIKGDEIEKALVTLGIIVIPTMLMVGGFKLSKRKVAWPPLVWAGVACIVYFALLRSGDVLPAPAFMADFTQNWFGKSLTIAASLILIIVLPGVQFRTVGLTLKQIDGSLRPVLGVGAILLLAVASTDFLTGFDPGRSMENLVFQATMPGLDEELFFHGLVLLLVHQAFGKGLAVWGANTGWGFWLVTAIFGLLHGIGIVGGELAVNAPAILMTGFTGFVLLWMRERTGSLVVPIIYHNVFNVVLALV
jgi:membrane protease YdiL (CAAX protease family)